MLRSRRGEDSASNEVSPSSHSNKNNLPTSVLELEPLRAQQSNTQQNGNEFPSWKTNRATIAVRTRRTFRFLMITCLLVALSVISLQFIYQCAEKLAGDTPLALTLRIASDFEVDDFSIGKSCVYDKRWGRWRCQDCGIPTSDDYGDKPRKKCKTLKPKGVVPPFPRSDWDAVPRSTSAFDPRSSLDVEIRTLSTVRGPSTYYYQNHPQCSFSNSVCFDLSRCNPERLTVYANATGSGRGLIDAAVQILHGSSEDNATLLERVEEFQDACIVLVTKDMYPSIEHVKEAPHWQNDGQNHLIWDMSRFRFPNAKRLSSDSPISLFHVGRAAVASESWTQAHIRRGFDLVLPLARQWGRPAPPEEVDIHRPRKWLLTFKGGIQNSVIPYYQHRWLAAEYWEEAPDILVDVNYKINGFMGARKTLRKEYQNTTMEHYGELMWESTFGFAPGGAGVSSYRCGEILSTGGIPVVTHDLVFPLSPEVDWNSCAYRVSEARVVDLPRLLRAIPEEEIRSRQKQCWFLLQTVIGDKPERQEDGQVVWKSDYEQTFARALQVLQVRILTALFEKSQQNSLQNSK